MQYHKQCLSDTKSKFPDEDQFTPTVLFGKVQQFHRLNILSGLGVSITSREHPNSLVLTELMIII